MSDQPIDWITSRLAWCWALARAAGDSARAAKWEAATLRALVLDDAEAPDLELSDSKTAQ
jgi:hypothetical protein